MGVLINLISPWVDDAGSVIDAFGILVILLASAAAAWAFVQAEFNGGTKKQALRDKVKASFVHRLVFGLDFLIAGDILQSVFAPTVDKLLLVGGIVVIRVLLSYSLMKELAVSSRGEKG